LAVRKDKETKVEVDDEELAAVEEDAFSYLQAGQANTTGGGASGFARPIKIVDLNSAMKATKCVVGFESIPRSQFLTLVLQGSCQRPRHEEG